VYLDVLALNSWTTVLKPVVARRVDVWAHPRALVPFLDVNYLHVLDTPPEWREGLKDGSKIPFPVA
jgi:hypothetical protein